MRKKWIPAMALIVVAASCGEPPEEENPRTPQDAFWASLQSLCGQAFSGTTVQSVPPDSTMTGQPLVMHVRECSGDVIRVPFYVGEDRSRTWVFTRSETGLRLKHDHRHEDGSEDEVTQYGGDTRDFGTETQQQFAADDFTANLLPASASNIWSVRVLPGETFGYALRRVDSERRFRAEFDLGTPVPAPPPPWGSN